MRRTSTKRRRSRVRSSSKKPNIYERITTRLLALMKEGELPWQRQWETRSAVPGSLLPRNGASGRFYNGINILMLWAEGRGDARWYTYLQAQNAGGQVRRAERGTEIVFFKTIEIDEPDEERDGDRSNRKKRHIPMPRAFTVFNHCQIDWGEGEPEPPSPTEGSPAAAAQQLIDDAGIVIDLGGDQAFYSSSHDLIRLPAFEDFESEDAYFSTALHEAVHWTGSQARLDRHSGKDDRAFEELVAEIGASFLCAHCGIESQDRHAAAYLKGWIEIGEKDEKAFFRAASKARQAVQFLFGGV